MKTTSTILLLLAIGALGCKNSTDPNTPLLATHAAGTGSSFTYQSWEVDTATGQPVSGSTRTATYHVIASGISQQGKTNVSQFVIDTDISHPLFVNYESNGDISVFVQSGGYPGDKNVWETIPIASKGSQSYTTFDSVYSDGTRYTSADNFTYGGQETVTLAGHTFNAVKIAVTQSLNPPPSYGTSPGETIWFAPETGWIIKEDQPVYTSVTYKERGYHLELSSYTIK